MEARLFYERPTLSRDERIGNPVTLCNDIFTLYHYEYFDMLDDFKAGCVNWLKFAEKRNLPSYSSHVLTVAAVNFAYNILGEWVNRTKLPTDKQPITHRYPVTLDNVLWLLLSTEITKTFSKEFGFKTILPLLMDTTVPAYEIGAVNDAIKANDEAANIGSDMDALILAVFTEYPDRIAEFKGGKASINNFFIGELIKRTKNKSPELRARVSELLMSV